jgi:hypothetical protein
MHFSCMTSHIQIRDVDAHVHQALIEKARRQNLSLTQFLKMELAKLASARSPDEIGDMLINLPRKGHVNGWTSQRVARIIREGREQRDEQIAQALGFDTDDMR